MFFQRKQFFNKDQKMNLLFFSKVDLIFFLIRVKMEEYLLFSQWRIEQDIQFGHLSNKSNIFTKYEVTSFF